MADCGRLDCSTFYRHHDWAFTPLGNAGLCLHTSGETMTTSRIRRLHYIGSHFLSVHFRERDDEDLDPCCDSGAVTRFSTCECCESTLINCQTSRLFRNHQSSSSAQGDCDQNGEPQDHADQDGEPTEAAIPHRKAFLAQLPATNGRGNTAPHKASDTGASWIVSTQ